MSAELFLGLDVGTQGTKALLLDGGSGSILARAGASYELLPDLPQGAAEQDPRQWDAAVATVVGELLAGGSFRPAQIKGIGVSGQQHGFVPLDGSGEVIRPAKLWCDTSTAEEARELSEAFGRAVPTGFTASKILWLKRHEPHHFERLRHVLLPHDYINFRLTGERTMEAGDASGTGFFDPRQREFARAWLDIIDERLFEMLPELLAPGVPAGTLSASAAGRLGLPAGITVAAGGGDNMMSAIGSGATRTGVTVVSLGTSGTVFSYSDRPLVDPDGLIAPFCDSTGGWLPLLCVMNLTGVTEEVRGASGNQDLAELTLAAEQVDEGCGGLLFLPYLQGERVPDLPGATGTLLGLRPGSLAPGTLFRAALEGTSLNLAWGVDRMRGLGLQVDAVRLVGGGSRNRLWRRILADCLDAPVACLEEAESAALGAALAACWTVRRQQGEEVSADDLASEVVKLQGEVVEPQSDSVARYRELGERFREAVGRLYPSG